MGLHRREMALGSSVRRTRGPSGVPGTAPVGGGVVQHVEIFDGPVSGATFPTAGKVITKVAAIGPGGDGNGSSGGGGGAYAETTTSLPSPLAATLNVFIDTSTATLDDGVDTLVLASGGGNPNGGAADEGIGDVGFNGGNGTGAAGGQAGQSTGNGANGGGTTNPGDGGGLNQSGKPGRVTITWH